MVERRFAVRLCPALVACWFATLCQLAGAQEVSKPIDLAVLYLGAPDTERALAFKGFLASHFRRVTIADRVSWDRKLADKVDVVVLDWPRPPDQFRLPKERPLGERDDWGTPTVLLGNAAFYVAQTWGLRGGMG